MSTEASAIFEKEKSSLLDEITKASPGRQRRISLNLILQSLEEVISLANSINRVHEDIVSIGETLLAESCLLQTREDTTS